jgi:septum formation protein
MRPVVLASASPGRLRTLTSVGLKPTVVVSGVDEDTITAANPSKLVERLAVAKARKVASELPSGQADAVVIGCDSMLDVDGTTLGKPGTPAAAAARWRQLRATSAVLRTGHCLIDAATGRQVSRTASTTVRFANLSDDEIAVYVATGEPIDVAGAFTIDGLGGAFVTTLDGDPHNVVGISLPLIRELLPAIGLHWLDIWPDLPDLPPRKMQR